MSTYVGPPKRSVKSVLGSLGYQVRKIPKVECEPIEPEPTEPEAIKSEPIKWEPIGLEGLIPPRDLWEGPGDPLFWFFGYMWDYKAYLTLLCGLRRDASVLELGCSHGRTMLGLIQYLEPPGRYEGLDIQPNKIAFAQEHIHPKYPFCNFTLSEVYNAVYNPRGSQRADSYRFPYEDGSFDVVYAASVYTHLLPPDGANYLKQIRRVLREGGQCLLSFFLLDHYRGPGTSIHKLYEFDYTLKEFDGFAVHTLDAPELVVAYKISLVEKMAAEAGLKIKRIIPGFWSKTHMVGVNDQDLILFEAA
jgi:SAM-dependent methyltransferase